MEKQQLTTSLIGPENSIFQKSKGSTVIYPDIAFHPFPQKPIVIKNPAHRKPPSQLFPSSTFLTPKIDLDPFNSFNSFNSSSR